MNFQHYQKMFPSPHQIQQQQQNGFSPMEFNPQFYHHPEQQQQQQFRQQSTGMSYPFSAMPKAMNNNFGGGYNNHNFMGNGSHHHQQHQPQHRNKGNTFHPPTFNLPLLPSTSSFDSGSMMLTNSSPSLTLSTEGSVKEETPREIFFRTLSASLKEANKFYSGKTTTWKNPFLYKTNLCDNYCNRSYCRYGVNCWYAHGPHELRCIPESDDLPDPAFICQYLSFLGLPKQTLEQIIQYAYYVATILTSPESPWFTSSKKSSELPSFDSTHSSSHSPIQENDLQLSAVGNPLTSLTPATVSSDPIKIPTTAATTNDKFLSSLASNGGWAEIESAINGIVGDENSGENDISGVDEKPSNNKSYRLFGESFNSQTAQPW